MEITKYNKFNVSVIVGVILLGAMKLGVAPDMTLEQTLTLLVGLVINSIAVRQIANKK
jgi:hypothetical protein